MDMLIRKGPYAAGLVPRGPVDRTSARNGPMVSPGRMALSPRVRRILRRTDGRRARVGQAGSFPAKGKNRR